MDPELDWALYEQDVEAARARHFLSHDPPEACDEHSLEATGWGWLGPNHAHLSLRFACTGRLLTFAIWAGKDG